MSKNHPVLHGLLALILGLGALSAIPSAQAATRWEAAHPRRDQVLDRTHNLQRRITQERRAGEISPMRAHRLRMQDRRLRQREQAMARRNGGYITRGQQAALNQQANRVSRHVGP